MRSAITVGISTEELICLGSYANWQSETHKILLLRLFAEARQQCR